MTARGLAIRPAVWLLFCGLLHASSPTTTVVERVRVISVEVPVQVTLKGQPVRGLSAENFRIFDNREPQAISGFRVVDLGLLHLGELWEPEERLPIAGRRHFLVVFDLSFSDPSAIARAQQQVRAWLTRSLHPTDLVAVATYGVESGAKLLLNFTSDREQVALATLTLGRPELVDRSADPLGLRLGTARNADLEDAYTVGLLDGSTTAFDDDTLRGSMPEDVFYGAFEPTHNQGRRVPIRQFSRSFGGLARLLASVRGRKYVVYFSEGFDSSLVFGEDDQQAISQMGEAVAEGALWRVDSAKRFGSGPTQSAVQGMIEEFRRSDCVIHAVDLGAFEAGRSRRVLPSSSDGLALLAHETGGEVYRSFADLSAALDRITKYTSLTYLLSFAPSHAKDDGAYHRLRVKLEDGPRGARLLHRPGYYAPRPFDEQGADERQLIASERIVDGGPGGAIDTAILATPFRASTPRARVPVLIEIDGLTLLEEHRGEAVGADIYAYAFDGSGSLSDFFTESVSINVDKLGSILRSSGLKFFGELALAPGEYSLRVLVLERDSGRTGVRVARLRVPDYAAAAPELLPPLFPDPRGKWLLARDSRLESAQDEFPFMLQGEPYLPAARPAIPERSEVQLHVLAYNLGEEPVRVEARVVGADGQTVRRADLPIDGRTRPAAGGPETLQTSFTTRGLEAGPYTLVLTLVDPLSGARPSSSIPFVVVPTEPGSPRRRTSG